ncbi:MAG TPA: hypothetical protein VFN26_17890 [Candidatus Acidoferrum sp.]|nr:hypothetical protein [Candidatus Acidoferrum sp.]
MKPGDFPIGSPPSRAAARALLLKRQETVPEFGWFCRPHLPDDSLPTYEDLAADVELLNCVGSFSHVVLHDEELLGEREDPPTYEELGEGWQAKSNSLGTQWKVRWKDKGQYFLSFSTGCAGVGVLSRASKLYQRIAAEAHAWRSA